MQICCFIKFNLFITSKKSRNLQSQCILVSDLSFSDAVGVGRSFQITGAIFHLFLLCMLFIVSTFCYFMPDISALSGINLLAWASQCAPGHLGY